MRFWIVETRATLAGHEIDFDRLLIEELRLKGYEVTLALPQGLKPKFDYRIPIHRLAAPAVPRPSRGGFLAKWFASLKGEWARRKIYAELRSLSAEYDTLIFPTATHRFLRALRFSSLKSSLQPVFFILDGPLPSEEIKLRRQIRALAGRPKIKVLVNTINKNQGPVGLPQVRLTFPPAHIPRDRPGRPGPGGAELLLGFFGQYRREKNLEGLLEAILKARLSRPVRFIIQGAPAGEADARHLSALAAAYGARDARLHFVSRPLVGPEWQEALLSLDGLLLPYGADRFLWHWSAMLFNAIGHGRPVLAARTVNPEVFERFSIGRLFDPDVPEALPRALEAFVADFDAQAPVWRQGLAEALEYYAPSRYVKNIVDLAGDYPRKTPGDPNL